MAELNVAIADDNPQTLGLLQDIVEGEEGFHVVGKADNGEDAYAMIVKTNPDIVLLDVIMPGLDGISVMEKIKRKRSLEKMLYFIMITAAGSVNVTADAFRMGASYYIMKPFNREIIVDKIHRVGKVPVGIPEAAEAKRIRPYIDKAEYMKQNLENDVTHILHEIGIPAHIKGYQYLRDAIIRSVEDHEMLT